MTSEERIIRFKEDGGFKFVECKIIFVKEDEELDTTIEVTITIDKSEPAPPKDYWEGPFCYNGESGKRNCKGAFPEKNDYHPTCVECPYRKRE